MNLIRTRRLRWTGHVARMGGDRLQKLVLESCFTGKKRKGRPREMR